MGISGSEDPLPESTKVRNIESFGQFVSEIETLEVNGTPWVYRGQAWSQALETTLERLLHRYDLDIQHGPEAEARLIEDFQRRYLGADSERVRQNRCYCLALMRHHRGPTRFLDWSYSAYVAAKFALDSRSGDKAGSNGRDGVVWCLNTAWLDRAVSALIGEPIVQQWNEQRDDASFDRVFCQPLRQAKFVYTSNPSVLNQRLSVQQGLFVGSGSASHSFIDGLRGLEGYQDNVVRLRLGLKGANIRRFAASLLRTNVHSASLFPGLDGLAESLGERLVRFCWEDQRNH